MTVVAVTERSGSLSNRWTQLLLGLIAMMAISSPQYVWTLFTGPLNQKLGTTLAEVQVTFSLLIVLQTFFSPFQAYLVDRFGPKLLISVGAIMSGGSWVLASYASSLTALYHTASLAALERASSMSVSSAWWCAGSLIGAAWRRVSPRRATASVRSLPASPSTT
jgi:MFS family permease